jgi:hypothetical protein
MRRRNGLAEAWVDRYSPLSAARAACLLSAMAAILNA